MENISNKEKVILVLKESIKAGREVNFVYNNMYEKHKDVLFIKKFRETIDEKIRLFENVHESSYLFQKIVDTAKMACVKLQEEEGYNYYSAELILKFNQLDNCFNKKLKPLGVRIVEQKEVVIKETVYNRSLDIEEYEEELVPLTRDAKYIGNGMTGKKFHSKLKKQQDISLALKENNFQD